MHLQNPHTHTECTSSFIYEEEEKNCVQCNCNTDISLRLLTRAVFVRLRGLFFSQWHGKICHQTILKHTHTQTQNKTHK